MIYRNFYYKFKQNNHAVVSIETSFSIGIIIIFLFAILEFSMIFALSTGLERVSREMGRQSSSISGTSFNNFLSGGGTLNRNDFFTQEIHKQITNIVLKPENVILCIDVYNSTNTFSSANIGLPTNCRQFNADPAIAPLSLNWGDNGNYVIVSISYQHDYLTPLARIVETLSDSITLTSLSFFRRS